MRTITEVILGLDHWFEAMRVDWPTPGYGGPVTHWWNHCLAFQGAGLDWRYEGIVDGYLSLWRTTGDQLWLDRAIQAGEDLVAGQLENGHFLNSRFELNPGEGGTPHEAACDAALLLLSLELSRLGHSAADHYRLAAERNLNVYYFGQLWHEPTRTLWDSPSVMSFVPNKAATFVEAVMLLGDLSGDETLLDRYAVPTGNQILAMQIKQPDALLDGAIAQNRFSDRVIHSYFPLYIARCIPALLQLFERTGAVRFRDGAFAAAAFLERVRNTDGGMPQVLYANGRRNRYPRWIAGAGDVVRALNLVYRYGTHGDVSITIDWIVRGARADGRIATAEGFGQVIPGISRRDRAADELGVVGWCDKAFRALAPLADPQFLVQHVSHAPVRAVPMDGVVR